MGDQCTLLYVNIFLLHSPFYIGINYTKMFRKKFHSTFSSNQHIIDGLVFNQPTKDITLGMYIQRVSKILSWMILIILTSKFLNIKIIKKPDFPNSDILFSRFRMVRFS